MALNPNEISNCLFFKFFYFINARLKLKKILQINKLLQVNMPILHVFQDSVTQTRAIIGLKFEIFSFENTFPFKSLAIAGTFNERLSIEVVAFKNEAALQITLTYFRIHPYFLKTYL